MPTVLRLWLVPQQDITLRPEGGSGQGWFLALARSLSPVWAEALHAGSEARPYALSPFYQPDPVPIAEDDQIGMSRLARGLIPAEKPLALRLSLADDAWAQRLCETLPALPVPRLGSAACLLARCPQWDAGDPDLLHAPWERLADAPPARRLHVSFETPTAFSHRGESLPLPDLEHLADSWRRAWAFAPSLPDGAASLSLEGLRVAGFDLKTEAMPIKAGLRIGCVGAMDLEWRPRTDLASMRALTALAGISDFLGTGAKTTLGLGQTRLRVLDNSE